jgi:outer membrane receptor protein involved in Fe transport
MRSSRFCIRRALVPVLLLLLSALPAGAQQANGRIVGQVVDAQTGRPLPGAQLMVEGTQMGSIAGLEGRFVLANVPAGTVSVRALMIGYATKTISGVEVPAAGVAQLNLTLESSAVELAGITVSVEQERGSVASALNQQRNATGVVSAITAEEISRSPDGDAAAAVRRVSGVTVQEGKYVFVRGLGERYTTTSLNGARVPSPEPERKVVPLDLFPSGLLQTITTAKTFTPDLPGDFSGAQVNIQTRSYPARRQFSVSASTGLNSEVTGQTILQAPGVGREWLALAASDRGLPSTVAQFGNFMETNPSQGDVNQMVGSFRNAWSTRTTSGSPSSSLSASVGGSDPLFGLRIGYLVSGTYSHSEEAKVDQVRAQALAQAGSGAEEVDRFEGTTGTASVLWGGLANFSTLWGNHSRFFVNTTYNRTADNEARFEEGFSENLGQQFQVQRLRYVERAVLSSQLAGEHQVNESNRLDWAVTRSGVARREPDRSEIVYQVESGEAPRWFNVSNEAAVRTFGDLDEESTEAALNYRLGFGSPRQRHEVRLGVMTRLTDRDAVNQVYSIGGILNQEQRSLTPEDIFDGRFSSNGQSVFRITPLSQGGSYRAEDRLYAGYLMLEWALAENIRVIGGARVEQNALTLEAQSTLGSPAVIEPEYTDVLPALSVNWRITDNQTLRLSGSQTLSRPEYRELANVQYREVLGGDNVLGNPDLKRTLIRNVDVRYEWYPGPAEAITVALFAKDFQDPIERIYLATSGTRVVTFANAESARNYGVELEVRKGLGGFAESLEPISIFSNVTLMQSDIQINTEGGSVTGQDRPMVGQSPYVLNAGITWAPQEGRSSATLLYNVSGKRISSAAEAPLPDVYEQARNILDLSLRFPLLGGVSVKADLKNLLDAPVEFLQGPVVREAYRTGRSLSLGMSWQP